MSSTQNDYILTSDVPEFLAAALGLDLRCKTDEGGTE